MNGIKIRSKIKIKKSDMDCRLLYSLRDTLRGSF